jgi:signal peptidase I
LLRAALAGLVLVLVSQLVLSPVRAVGISMLPTYRDGQFLLLNRLAFRVGTPRRGDVVGIRIAGGRALLIKRVIGLPGERVSISNGLVHVNGQPLNEPYVSLRSAWNVGEVPLDADEFFVVGDNRSMPPRSHDFGRVRRARLEGRLVF